MKNPLIWADVPDPDVLRVGDFFYMTSTTMHYTPGVPVMRSEDLRHWEIVSYVYDTLEDTHDHRLEAGESIYGGGSWASSLRHHGNMFYVCFACNNTQKTYIYKTDNLECGKWSRTVLDNLYHDPSLFFDEQRVFIVYGAGSINAVELTPDASAVKPGTTPLEIISMGSPGDYVPGEGSHVYKIGDWYYIFIIQWPRESQKQKNEKGRRIQWCYRSRVLLGDYEGKVVFDDDMGYGNNGVAQGGIFALADGRFFSMLFQDHGAVGRVPVLVGLSWEDGWPVFGDAGTMPSEMPDPLPPKPLVEHLLTSDGFDTPLLKRQWQWNHNPDNTNWSLSERPGYLRIRAGSTVSGIHEARNTLTQRTMGPVSSGEIFLDTRGMNRGDYAGIAAFQSVYGSIGVYIRDDGTRSIRLYFKNPEGIPAREISLKDNQEKVHLKVICDFTGTKDSAEFAYATDGGAWITLEDTLAMKYTLDHFTGYRFALFYYATAVPGGYADFDYFKAAISE
ncbi:MAG: glycoside hydrolase 43 family protein [Spirochaetales bacterium]|nr:glycoside hydrolase 43 family protein [Spirochaetales bacterium]